FRPTAEALEFGKTNFGFLAVRVAKNLSAHFGGGTITGSAGDRGEPAIFGKRARWVDYGGPVPNGEVEGSTYSDHPFNPGHPAQPLKSTSSPCQIKLTLIFPILTI